MKTNHYKKFNPIRDEVGKPVCRIIFKKLLYRRDAWKTENTLTLHDKTFGEHTVGAFVLDYGRSFWNAGLEVTGFADESNFTIHGVCRISDSIWLFDWTWCQCVVDCPFGLFFIMTVILLPHLASWIMLMFGSKEITMVISAVTLWMKNLMKNFKKRILSRLLKLRAWGVGNLSP